MATKPEQERVDSDGVFASAAATRRSVPDRMLNVASNGLRHAWRLTVLVVGLTVLAIGTAMIVLPGPAFVVIPIGLGILATEFVWARRLLHTLKQRAQNLVQRNGGQQRSDD